MGWPQPAAERVIAQALDPAAVQDTLARVFAHARFDRSLRETVWSRLVGWVGEALAAVARAAARAPRPVYWGALALLAALALLVVGRVLYGAYLRRGQVASLDEAGGTRGRGSGGAARDAWLLAQRLAARGDYTAGAHALYQALLETLAARERVRLHPSKTVGDYARDLRRGSSALLGRFRDFARTYEAVVYGDVVCDRARYERLRALAAPLVGRDA